MTTEELIAARRAEPWREALRKSKKNKERADIPRVKMNELDPEYRSRTRLEEVNLGLTKEQAMQEAERCLDCPNPTCMQGCPVNINIPTFIKNIERGEFLEAAKTLKETSALPAVCGRVCPQEKQCESKCIHLKMSKEAVAIGYLERFAADYERESGNISVPEIAEKNGIKIAVVGSGPAGLSFAGDMAKRGYDVTVFEALHEIGGVLKYGIPEFRLPNKIVDVEIDGLRKMGVQFEKDCIVGKTIRELGYEPGLQKKADYIAIKQPVFSFEKLRGAETSLGPEMKSTGEVLGIAKTFEEALYKSFIGAGINLPRTKKMICTVNDADKDELVPIAARFQKLGYTIYATRSTADKLIENGIPAIKIKKISAGSPNALDLILAGEVDLVIDTPTQGRDKSRDGFLIRRNAIETGCTCLTSLDTAAALVTSLENANMETLSVIDIAEI